MRNTILLISLVLISTVLFGQSRKSKEKPTDSDGFYIGLNTTNVLKNVLSFNSSSIEDPYSLIAYYRKNNEAFRMGLGVSHRSLLNQTNSFADNANSSIDLRIGFQKFKHLWHKFSMYYGLDVTGSWEKDISVLNNFSNKDIIVSFGVGPVLGFHFQFNKRMSIGTESTLYFNYSQKETSFQHVNGPNEIVKSEVYKLTHLLPNSLYIYFTF